MLAGAVQLLWELDGIDTSHKLEDVSLALKRPTLLPVPCLLELDPLLLLPSLPPSLSLPLLLVAFKKESKWQVSVDSANELLPAELVGNHQTARRCVFNNNKRHDAFQSTLLTAMSCSDLRLELCFIKFECSVLLKNLLNCDKQSHKDQH